MKRIFYLDFIRVISCLIVVLFHISCYLVDVLNVKGCIFYLSANTSWGAIGVSFFFIISGVALSYSYGEKNFDLKKYIKKRFLGIYPMFWIAYFLVFLYQILKDPAQFSNIPVFNFIYTIFGLDGYLYTVAAPNFYILGEWFLGVIIICYALFPIILYFFKRFPKLLAVFSIITYVILILLFDSEYTHINIDMSVTAHLIEFIFGIYYVKYYDKIRLSGGMLAGLVFIIFLFVPFGIKNTNISRMITTLCNIFGFVSISYFVNLLKNCQMIYSVFNASSKLTYSVFLLHHIIINVLTMRIYNITNSITGVYIIDLIAVILASFLFYYLYKLLCIVCKKILFNIRKGEKIGTD